MSKLATQKYYARLVHKGIYKMDMIPDEDKEAVSKFVKEMGERIPDPITETPVNEESVESEEI